MSLEIIALGTGLSLQDAGRFGWRRFGVPPGGALDGHGMRMANHLLGNSPEAPVLEVFRQGARLRVLEDMWVGLAGADCCPGLPAWSARRVRAGEELAFAQRAAGVFSYLSVPGGFRAERWFGSVSVDVRNGLGRPLRRGDLLAAGRLDSERIDPQVSARQLDPELRRDYAGAPCFELLPGPQYRAFSLGAQAALVAEPWVVSSQSDRTGYRLEGRALAVPDPIVSEPVLPGSFQVPGNGQPIITLADGPTVGGYPKLAVLREADRDRLAQCAPGTHISFRWAGY